MNVLLALPSTFWWEDILEYIKEEIAGIIQQE